MMKPRTCQHCRWWDNKPGWDIAATLAETKAWIAARECLHPQLKICSAHVAYPNYDGPPTSLPDFGCIQYEAAGTEP